MAAQYRLTAEVKKDVIDTFLKGKYTLLEIAKIYNLSESEVSYLVTNYFKSKKKKNENSKNRIS